MYQVRFTLISNQCILNSLNIPWIIISLINRVFFQTQVNISTTIKIQYKFNLNSCSHKFNPFDPTRYKYNIFSLNTPITSYNYNAMGVVGGLPLSLGLCILKGADSNFSKQNLHQLSRIILNRVLLLNYGIENSQQVKFGTSFQV